VTAASGVPFYEPLDTVEFFVGEPDITLRALEGIVDLPGPGHGHHR
jgi:hypothetical protein